jgi:uncharacterized protein with PIN domain
MADSIKQWLRCVINGHTDVTRKGYKLCLDCGRRIPLKSKEETVADIKDLMKKENKDA